MNFNAPIIHFKGRKLLFDCIFVVKLHNVVQSGSPIFIQWFS